MQLRRGGINLHKNERTREIERGYLQVRKYMRSNEVGIENAAMEYVGECIEFWTCLHICFLLQCDCNASLREWGFMVLSYSLAMCQIVRWHGNICMFRVFSRPGYATERIRPGCDVSRLDHALDGLAQLQRYSRPV